jgi:6,7-dimethyl-8-ribityllumazine synthase
MALKPIAYVQATWHTEITDHCRTAFMAEMAKHGYGADDVQLFSVPGSLEIPLMARKLAQTRRYAAVCASGLVVNGGIYRHDFVAQAVLHGIVQTSHGSACAVRCAHTAPFSRARGPRGVLQAVHANERHGARRGVRSDHRPARRSRLTVAASARRSGEIVRGAPQAEALEPGSQKQAARSGQPA